MGEGGAELMMVWVRECRADDGMGEGGAELMMVWVREVQS